MTQTILTVEAETAPPSLLVGGKSRTVAGTGTSDLVASRGPAQMTFLTEAAETTLVDVVVPRGFRVARLMAGVYDDLVFAVELEEGAIRKALLQSPRVLPAKAYVIAVLENITTGMASPSASFVIEEVGQAPAQAGAAAPPPPSPLERLPVGGPKELRAFPIERHHVDTLARWLDNHPQGHISHTARMHLAGLLERAHARTERIPDKLDPKGIMVLAKIPEPHLRWLADVIAQKPRPLHPEDVKFIAAALRRATSPEAPPAEPLPEVVAPPLSPAGIPGRPASIAQQVGDVRPVGALNCDLCKVLPGPGERRLVLSAVQIAFGDQVTEDVSTVGGAEVVICPACASPAHVGAAMRDIAAQVTAFLNGKVTT